MILKTLPSHGLYRVNLQLSVEENRATITRMS